MKTIIARILATANQLDNSLLYEEADKLTKIAQNFGELEQPSMFEQEFENQDTYKCQHENVEYEGNDGQREITRRCWGTCLDCGAALEGYEEIDGADDEGKAEYSVVQWKEDTPLNQLMASANMLDQKGLYKFADMITKIAQEAFNPPKKDIYAELKMFLSSLEGINTNYTINNEVVIGAGMANHIKSEAQRLLVELAEYTGEEEENQEGQTDEQLFGVAEEQAIRGDTEQRMLEDAGRWNGY